MATVEELLHKLAVDPNIDRIGVSTDGQGTVILTVFHGLYSKPKSFEGKKMKDVLTKAIDILMVK